MTPDTIWEYRSGIAIASAVFLVKHITGKPIKFASVGEKMNDLEMFHPDRVASRILGMGDVLTLIDKAQQAFDEKEAIALEKKIKEHGLDMKLMDVEFKFDKSKVLFFFTAEGRIDFRELVKGHLDSF